MQLRHAREAEAGAITLAEEVGVLITWLRQDVLAVPGGNYPERCALSDWIVAELKRREPLCSHRLRPVRVLLENPREALLGFAKKLDEELRTLAEEYEVPVTLVEQVRAIQSMSGYSPERWQRESALWQRWGERYGLVRQAVTELVQGVVRPSRVIESLNSRLRNYFFLRRHLGGEYLSLVQYFLNHRRFVRSAPPSGSGRVRLNY